jgi:hypothetical protein
MLKVAAACALSCSACTTDDLGQIVIAIQTDVHLPKDIDTIRVEVRNEGVPKFEFDYERLGTEDSTILLPGTLTLVESDDPSDAIQVIVSARAGGKEGELRIVREAVTTIPEGRIVTLQLPLQFLCDDSGVIENGEVRSNCPEGQTCLAGHCADATVDSAGLPDYLADEIYVPGVCIDVALCFNQGTVVTVDADCSIDGVTDTNIALQTEGDGICGGVGCFVALDGNSALGWQTRPDGRVQLPTAVCEQIDAGKIVNVVTASANDACPFKTVSVPTCGPWSAAGDGASLDGAIVLAGGQSQPVSLRLGAGSLLWSSAGISAGSGSIKAVSFDGGTPTALALNQPTPRDLIAVDGDALWTTSPGGMNGTIERVSAGVQTTLLSGLTLPEGLAENGSSLFWTTFDPMGGIFQANLQSPGTPLLIATGNYPFRVVADARFVYWTNEGTFGSAPADGAVARYDLTGGMGLELIADEQDTPRGLTLDESSGEATAVYWTTFAINGAVRRATITNGVLGAVETLVTGQNLPNGIAVDGTHVYWSNRGAGTVLRLPKTASMGAAPEVLASEQRSPSALAFDETSIYWLNEGTAAGDDGAVVRLAKPL